MQHETNLLAKVAARNNVNALLRNSAQAILEAIRPFVGKKIKLAAGGWTKEFAAVLAKLPGSHSSSASYSLSRSFKVSEQGPRSCFYGEATLYIGDIDGQVLKDMVYAETFKPENFRTDYSAAAVLEGRAAVRKAREALSEAERAICYFGEHDNN